MRPQESKMMELEPLGTRFPGGSEIFLAEL
jgi:hypothetical protein